MSMSEAEVGALWAARGSEVEGFVERLLRERDVLREKLSSLLNQQEEREELEKKKRRKNRQAYEEALLCAWDASCRAEVPGGAGSRARELRLIERLDREKIEFCIKITGTMSMYWIYRDIRRNQK